MKSRLKLSTFIKLLLWTGVAIMIIGNFLFLSDILGNLRGRAEEKKFDDKFESSETKWKAPDSTVLPERATLQRSGESLPLLWINTLPKTSDTKI